MEITLEVPDKHTARVLELLKGIKRVKVKSIAATPLTPAKMEFLAGLKESIEDVKRHQRGEIELPGWNQLHAELNTEETTEEIEKEVAKRTPAQPKGKPTAGNKPRTQAS